MPKDQWARNVKARKHRRGPVKPAKPQTTAAWASFDRVMSGEALPRDVITERQSLADARKPIGKKKRKKKQPRNQGKSQGNPPERGRRNRRNRKKPGKRIWVESYSDYLKSPHWLATRKDAMNYHGHKCADCGATGLLEVHHLTYERLGCEKMKDLLVLCGTCHRIRHEDKQSVVTTDQLSEQFRAIVGCP